MDVFREGKFKLFALMEMKLKGNREVSWHGVNGIIASVQEMERAKEGVAIMLNDLWHSEVIDFGCVSSKEWIIFKFSRIKVCVVVVYISSEEDGEERDILE